MRSNNCRTAVTALASINRLSREGGAIRPSRHRRLEAPTNIRKRAGARMLLASAWLAVLLALSGTVANPQVPNSRKEIDTDRSVLTIRVYKAGLLGAFGHEHEIRAPIREGTFDEHKKTVDLVVDSRRLAVLDSDISDKDRAEIQNTMLGPKVLDSAEFAEIRFHSTAVDRTSDNRWSVHGDLTLHGQNHPIQVAVERLNGRYRGSAQLRQKEFGITPVTVAGGSIKVKDEIRVEFEIVGKAN
jgi:polyisoprenoid-binding protein YceI